MSPTTNNEQVEISSWGQVDVSSKTKNSGDDDGDEVIGNDWSQVAAVAKGLVRSYSSEVVFP